MAGEENAPTSSLGSRAERVVLGIVLLATTIGAGAREWGISNGIVDATVNVLVVTGFFLMLPSAKGSRRIFAGVAIAISLIAMAVAPDWQTVLGDSLSRAGFLIAFFASMTSLGVPAKVSPAILRCGHFLAQQPPGRRYFALTIGGQLFSIFVNYGSIVLLGNMSVANAQQEKDPRVRQIRTRRMLLAIHRAMVSTIPWSPLSFSVTVTLLMIPETDWAHMVLPGLVTGLIMALVGLVLDIALKPARTGAARPRPRAEGTWFSIWPLLLLLALLAALLLGLNALTAVRIPGLIIAIAPALALCWLALQSRGRGMPKRVVQGAGAYASTDLPLMRSELLVLMMASYVGTVGGGLAVSFAGGLNLDHTALPAIVFLLGMVWLVPLAGQLGVHPLLAVSLLFPLLPSAAELGVDPSVVATATLAGWALSSASSPFTATVVLVASYAGVTANDVARKWNGLYALVLAVALSAWVVFYS